MSGNGQDPTHTRPMSPKEYDLQKRVVQIARIARSAAQSQIVTQRLGYEADPKHPERRVQVLRETPPEPVSNETTILGVLLRMYLPADALEGVPA